MKKTILITLGFTISSILLAQKPVAEQEKRIQTKLELNTIVDTIANKIARLYIYPEKGSHIAKEFKAWCSKQYKTFPMDYSIFSKESTQYLKNISNDKHFIVQVNKAAPDSEGIELPSTIDFGPDKGYGFRKYELLRGNIGLIKYTFFNFMVPGAITTIDQIAAQLSNTKAIIIDLRDNPGGDGGMADYFISYFLPKDSVYLSTFDMRDNYGIIDRSESYSYLSLPEKRLYNKPLYVLVNNNTGSSAEYFAFLCQQHAIAKVVGTQTSGAGHSLKIQKVNSHLTLGVPAGRLYNKKTGLGWEETNGIVPDFIVPDSIALKEAHKIALKATEKKL